MAAAYRAQASRLNSSTLVTSFTLTLDAATGAGDICLVAFEADAGVSGISGLGATWSRVQQGNVAGDNTELWQGVGCTSGNTTITVTLTASDRCDAMAVVISGASAVLSTAKSTATATGGIAVAPTQTATASGQAVVDFFIVNGGFLTVSYTDTPAAFTTVHAATGSAWYSAGWASAYRISTGTGSHSRTLNTGVSSNLAAITYSALVGDPPPSSPTSLAASRTARGFAATATATHTVSGSLTAIRGARGFTAPSGAAVSTAASWARGARGFTLGAGSTVSTGAGRPDATVAGGWSRVGRDFQAAPDVEPPVDLPPATHPPTLYRRNSYSYTPPTVAADGWSNPTQTRTLINSSIVGRHRFRFEGVDRSYFRGVPMRLVEDSHASPFGPGIAVIRMPQLTPFEQPGTGAWAWLHDGTRVIVDLLDALNHPVPGWSWRGYVHNITPELGESSWGVTVEAKGFLFEGDDAINKPLPINRGADLVPIGYRVADVLNHAETRRYTRLDRVDTSPATTRQRGSMSQTIVGFVRDLLAQAWTSNGRQWTVLDIPGTIQGQIVLPHPTTVDYTLAAGQEGVTFDLHEEQDEQPNVIYGEWVDPNGGRHQRLKYPRLHEDLAPNYPLTVGAVFSAGDGHTGFQPFSDWMRRNGFSGFDSQDTYLASDIDDVEAAQRRMGITVDGVVGAQTWGTAFNTGADVGNLFQAVYLPIAADMRVMKWLYAPDGAVLGRNPTYDPSLRRKEQYINFGEGLTYKEVRRSAEQLVNRSITGISLVGQITVTGTDFEECSKLVARGGTTLRARYLYGTGSAGVIFHMAQIHRVYGDDGTVTATLDVDTKWRDAYTVAQIIERRKAARDDPARAIRHRQTSGLSQDTKIQYDADDVGRIYRHNVQGGFWRIVEFPAATWGTFVRVTAVTSPATEFALMLFAKEITARDLDRLVGNPLSKSHPYNPEATALKNAGLIQAWGSADQPAGYSKQDAADGYKSDGDTLTGRLEYDSSVEFGPDNGSSLFLAEWCAASTVIHETLDLQPVSV